MKKFLMTCIIAMTSAGIYGFIDMSRDIHNGTMIKYEDQSEPMAKAYTHARTQKQAVNNAIREKLAVLAANKKKEESKIILQDMNVKASYFSRGEEIYEPPTQADLLEEEEAPNMEEVSTTVVPVKADTVKTVPPSTAQVEVTSTQEKPLAEVTVGTTADISPRYFSRGSPKYYKKSIAKK